MKNQKGKLIIENFKEDLCKKEVEEGKKMNMKSKSTKGNINVKFKRRM